MLSHERFSRLATARLHAKKKSLICSEQLTPKVRQQRAAWRYRIKDIEPERIKFLDQTNAKTTFTRLYARALRGERVREYVPDGRWKSLTLMGSLGFHGETTGFTYEGGTDDMAVVTYAEEILAPQLTSSDILALDRLATHMNPGVIEALKKTGAKVWHLPPYSHDYNPIEHLWSKVKAYLRKVKPRDIEALIKAIGEALRMITAADALGWYRDCGYVK
jgi:transposase